MTTKGTPGRVVRIDDDTWVAYGELCAAEGTNRADDLRRHAHARVAEWRKAQGEAAPKKRVIRVPKRPSSD
jgi:polyhydroxyalkanoate synthesis regulator phasin